MEVLDHLEFGLEAEIRNAIMGINTPAELVYARQYGYNDTSKRINIFDGTGVNYLLQDNDMSIDADFTVDANKLTTRDAIRIYVESVIGGVGAFRGDHAANTGLPTSTNIKAGDYWRITTGGAITGLSPVEDLQSGDLLFAKIDNAEFVSDFFAVQGNFATAADVALLSTGSYGGLATNVQGALEELYSRTNPFDLGNGLGYQTGTGTGTGTTLHVLFGSGLSLDVSNQIEVNLSDFVSGAAATGTEILASIGTGANLGKIVLDSADITAAIGDFLPLAGTGATVDTKMSGLIEWQDSTDSTGGIQFKSSRDVVGNYTSVATIGHGGSGILLSNVGNHEGLSYSSSVNIHRGEIEVLLQDGAVNSSKRNAIYYSSDKSARWNTFADTIKDRIVPDIGYVKSLISGGGSAIPWLDKAGQGINYTGSIYNIDLDANSGLELNGTSPDGKLRIKGLADYSAVVAGNQVPLGFNASGNLIADKSLLGLADYLPLAGNTAGTPMTGDIFYNSDINIQKANDPYNGLYLNNTIELITQEVITGSDYGSKLTLQKNGFIRLLTSSHMGGGVGRTAYININPTNRKIEFVVRNGSTGEDIFAGCSSDSQAFYYDSNNHTHWNTLAVGVRDRILPDIGYVKSLIGSSVDFAAKAGDGINYTGSIYNIDLDTNSGLELNGTSPDGKLRIKGLADYSAVVAGDQVALGYGTGGNLVIDKALLVGDYLPLTGTAGADVLSGTVNVASGLKFELTDTTNKAKFEFLNSNGFSANSNSADDAKRAWLQLNGSAGTAALFTAHTTANNAEINLSEFGAQITAANGANVARATMSLARKGFFYEADYSATWNGLTQAEKDRMIPDIAYVNAAITTGGRQSFDITGTGAIRIFNITHTKGAFPIVQIYRVDTGTIVTATVTNISATETRITFAANVPLGRVHKVVIL